MNRPGSDEIQRIIVIDDNENIHRDFRKILSSLEKQTDNHLGELENLIFETNVDSEWFELEIDSALQGERGCQMVRDAVQAGRRYAVAFIDIRMPPGWDGVETAQKIWQVDDSIKIVICTAHAEHTEPELKKRLGDAAEKLIILKKPFDPEQVSQIVKSRLRQDRSIAERK